MRIVRHSRGLWAALGGCVLLASVAARGQTPAGGAPATVYIFRERLYAGSALKPSVYCDGVELARIQNGRYFRVRLDPGRHTFRSTAQEPDVALVAKPGEVYYLQVEIVPHGFKGRARLTLLPPGESPYTIRDLRALDADMVKDRARVSAAGEIPDSPSLRDLEPLRPAAPAPVAVPTPAPAPTPPPAAALAPPAQPATLVVKSTPDGCEILLDGKFMGSTPSTLRVSPGDHTFTIGKAGFKPWQRTMTIISEGMVTIDATLEKAP